MRSSFSSSCHSTVHVQIAGAAGKDAQVHKLVAKLSPHYRNTYSLAGTFTFELPVRDTKLSQVFADLIAARKVRRPQRRRAGTVMPCIPLASLVFYGCSRQTPPR